MFHVFQSTLLQEERLNMSLSESSSFFFQSTLLQEERRHIQFLSFNVSRLSIHAPTRGATALYDIQQRGGDTFNPRSYKRSDSDFSSRFKNWKTFNPRSYKRSDDGVGGFFELDEDFQSTLLQEERPVSTFII